MAKRKRSVKIRHAIELGNEEIINVIKSKYTTLFNKVEAKLAKEKTPYVKVMSKARKRRLKARGIKV